MCQQTCVCIKHATRNIRLRTDKPSDLGVVISAVEIIEPAFPIVVIAAVAERILVADAGGDGIAVGIYNLEHFTPCVIEILNDQITVGITNLNDIALEVQDIVIQGTVIALCGAPF